MYITLTREYAEEFTSGVGHPASIDRLEVGDIPDDANLAAQTIIALMEAFFARNEANPLFMSGVTTASRTVAVAEE